MAGKGDTPRPVDSAKFAAGHLLTYGKKRAIGSTIKDVIEAWLITRGYDGLVKGDPDQPECVCLVVSLCSGCLGRCEECQPFEIVEKK